MNKSDENKVIGILAGMGPSSTAPFLNLVIEQCRVQYAAKDDIDFPHMIVYSLPTPFYLDRPLDHEAMKKALIGGLKKLESIGVNFIAMPSNTVHIYYDELQSSISIPLLNIIEETVKNIPAGKRVTLLATEATFKSHLYQDMLKRKCSFIFQNSWQQDVNKLITKVHQRKSITSTWNLLLTKLKEKKVEVVILGCTDLSILPRLHFSYIDSSEKLAKATVQRYIKL